MWYWYLVEHKNGASRFVLLERSAVQAKRHCALGREHQYTAARISKKHARELYERKQRTPYSDTRFFDDPTNY